MNDEGFLTFGAPVVGEDDIAEVVAALRSGWIGTGPRVERFERALEDYLGVAHVRCVSSCTAALTLGMRALGLGSGDEVIVPAMTFVATAGAVLHAGAEPVLVDCEPGTGLIDLAAAEAAITPRTCAIVVVHLAGAPVDLDAVAALARRHDLLVVEDAAHAIGGAWRGRRIGAHGNLVAFSFHATKNLTTGEGGAIATPDGEVARAVERLAMHGLSAGAWQRHRDDGFLHYEAEVLGDKRNLTDVQAALGLQQLARLDDRVAARAARWRRYDALLTGLPLELPVPPADGGGTVHARHLYRVAVPAGVRDAVLDHLTAAGIGAGVHYRGVHLHPFYARRGGLSPGDLPVTRDQSDRTLSLPLSPVLTDAQQRAVADALAAALQSVGANGGPTCSGTRAQAR